MKTLLFSATIGTLLLLSATQTGAQSRGELVAPLPTAMTSAKTVFISSNGNGSPAYEAFCDGMREWGRYEIVSSASEADLIIELSDRDTDKIAPSWSGGNAFVATQPKHENKATHQVMLTIYDSKTNEILWSASDPQKRAKREKNRQREAIESVQHLISNLEMRTLAPQ